MPLFFFLGPNPSWVHQPGIKRVVELGDRFKEVMGEPSTEPFGTPKRICPTISANSIEPFKTEAVGSPRRICAGEAETLLEPWWNLACWRNLAGTFHGTLWRPKMDLLQRTIESRKGIHAPKPLLWPKTPKPLLFGRKVGAFYQEILVRTIGERYLQQDYWGIVSEDMFGTFLGTITN